MRRDYSTITDFSEDGLALEFGDEHEDTLLYVMSERRWYYRMGDAHPWEPDETLLIENSIRRFLREVAGDNPRISGIGLRLGSAKTMKAVERLLRSQFSVATVETQ